GGATPEDVKLMYETVKDTGLKVKAAGGIRSLADAEKMIEAGAERLGCSAGMQIMKDFEAKQ
ncbi:MAG: 2-deoxyribose-5-phosphate aldolase, partial [Erysipelotrichaceae bacterium]|nr:2-deoxyribose-5-phosphate aldolase [Erysipelotrichaceae bacterium]